MLVITAKEIIKFFITTYFRVCCHGIRVSFTKLSLYAMNCYYLYKYYFELIPEFQEHFTQECVWKFIHNKSAWKMKVKGKLHFSCENARLRLSVLIIHYAACTNQKKYFGGNIQKRSWLSYRSIIWPESTISSSKFIAESFVTL